MKKPVVMILIVVAVMIAAACSCPLTSKKDNNSLVESFLPGVVNDDDDATSEDSDGIEIKGLDIEDLVKESIESGILSDDMMSQFSGLMACDANGSIPEIPMVAGNNEVIVETGCMIYYSTNKTVSDVAEFYESEMENDGWEPSQNDITKTKDHVVLIYSKGDLNANIAISIGGLSDAETSVVFTYSNK